MFHHFVGDGRCLEMFHQGWHPRDEQTDSFYHQTAQLRSDILLGFCFIALIPMHVETTTKPLHSSQIPLIIWLCDWHSVYLNYNGMCAFMLPCIIQNQILLKSLTTGRIKQYEVTIRNHFYVCVCVCVCVCLSVCASTNLFVCLSCITTFGRCITPRTYNFKVQTRGAVMAQWIRPQTLNHEIPGSSLLAAAVVPLARH